MRSAGNGPRVSNVWRGRVGIPGLFDGTHHFVIHPVDEGSVKFSQHEDFSGIFVPFVGFEPYRKGWEKMNAALKRRAEQTNPRAERGLQGASLDAIRKRPVAFCNLVSSVADPGACQRYRSTRIIRFPHQHE